MKNDFDNTRYEAVARELIELEESHDFDKAMAGLKRTLRLLVVTIRDGKYDETDEEFIHWINPYER